MKEIWFGIANRQISSMFDRVLCPQHDNGRVLLFVCVEVLQPSQPNEVMSSAVSLPNHMFTGQA